MKTCKFIAGVLLSALSVTPISAQTLPQLKKMGAATQLIVDGKPYIGLGGELHNSSPSNPAYMAPIWDKLAKNGVDTVVGVSSWELVEPQEGRFDFVAVDDQIRQAKSHGMKLVLIWFGAYKNAASTYAPSWVRRDLERFPRATRSPNFRSTRPLRSDQPVLSVFSDALAQSDAKAFAALMRHIRSVDRDQTVVMVQVENEIGLLGESRDRSPLADAAWRQQVPVELLNYLRDHRTVLRSEVLLPWAKQNYRTSGTWAEVFGTDAAAEEIFMAWGFARYSERVAKAGSSEYGLPMYVNAWLGGIPGFGNPGDYPTGGPVARMIDVYKAAAPTIVLVAPDIYVDDFDGTLADFYRPDNPIFIPEARFDAGNLFVALGKYSAIIFSPFGIEDGTESERGGDEASKVFKAYQLLGGMKSLIATAQQQSAIRGFKIPAGGNQRETIGGYNLEITQYRGRRGAFGPGTATADESNVVGFGMVLNTGPDEFLLVGQGFAANFTKAGAVIEVDAAEEGVFDKGRWIPGRTLNGDERNSLIPPNQLRIVRVKLLARPPG